LKWICLCKHSKTSAVCKIAKTVFGKYVYFIKYPFVFCYIWYMVRACWYGSAVLSPAPTPPACPHEGAQLLPLTQLTHADLNRLLAFNFYPLLSSLISKKLFNFMVQAFTVQMIIT
jgi:hypothetical protein